MTSINYTAGKRPETLVYALKTDADTVMGKTVQQMRSHPPDNVATFRAACKDTHWEGVYVQGHAAPKSVQTDIPTPLR
jgi:hypothetical protein